MESEPFSGHAYCLVIIRPCAKHISPLCEPLKLPTDVQAVGHDCDLALLSVEDEAFWSTPTDMLPLELGPLPSLQTVSDSSCFLLRSVCV